MASEVDGSRAEALQNIDGLVQGFRPNLFMTCEESAFLSTAFGPDFLDRAVTRDQFLGAFKVASSANLQKP